MLYPTNVSARQSVPCGPEAMTTTDRLEVYCFVERQNTLPHLRLGNMGMHYNDNKNAHKLWDEAKRNVFKP